MTSVLVTGAGGYIGQRVTHRLAADGVDVRALVRTAVPWPGGVEQIVGDLVTDPGLAATCTRGIDVVIHLAGANEVAMADDPVRAMADTITAAQRIADSGVARVIYLSTVHVYGGALVPGALVGEDTPPSPLHPYAEARLACEDIFTSSDVPSLLFRLTNGVGAPTRPDVRRWSLVANELCREGVTSGTLTLRSDGVQWRDFIALQDVESALSDLIHRPSVHGLYNLGSGTSITIRDLVGLIQESFVELGQARPELVAPAPPPDPPGPYRVDVTRFRQLGLKPPTPLSTALAETVAFCLAHRQTLH
jgi:UDP-glucose 4-epimerase